MLTGRDLWFRYGPRRPWVLEGVDIDVAPGQVVGLWGPSGGGKSTLAAILGGLRSPDRGRVRVDERALASISGPRPVQLVLQQPERAMNPRWRIRDVLAEARPDGAQVATAGGDLVEGDWLARFPHELSGGELQRVNLARALLVEPRYLLADEISSSLDAITQAQLWHHVLAQVHGRGLGVLAVSHDRSLLTRVADEVVELADLASSRAGGTGAGSRSLPRH